MLRMSARPEAVDRLVLVSHCAHVPVLAAQELQEAVLRVVRVLVLVDEDVAERLPPALERLGEALEDLHREHEDVVEVDGVRGVEAALVQLVRLGDGLVPERRDARAAYSSGVTSSFFAREICAWIPRGEKRFGSLPSSSRHALTSRTWSWLS